MKIAVLDMETDPFQYNRVPLPFACGLFDGDNYYETWGDSCVGDMLKILRHYPGKLRIYAHNGGKFDYYFLAHAIEEPVSFIDSRLVKGMLYQHEIRDSYKILPVPLAQINKDEIDYRKMEAHCRDRHRDEIGRYLKSDCTYLYDAVKRFIMDFGDVLTIGGAAMRELKKDYPLEHLEADDDKTYREFFHGGRCECFEAGVLKAPKQWKLFDVNSMYPHVMASVEHPVGIADFVCSELPDAPFYLAHISAKSQGALPLRTRDGLSFPHGHFDFFATSHEIEAGIELGLLEVTHVNECFAWEETRKFDKFINRFNAAKIKAEETGDKAGRLFNKLISNNAYGKFATNPERFMKYKLFANVDQCMAAGFEPDGDIGERIIGAIPAPVRRDSYYNVATGASITGAARAILLRAIHSAERPVYCDTDSLWCTDLKLEQHATRLGAWKLEEQCKTLYIAGKKLYAAQDTKGSFYKDDKKLKPIKSASKGVRMKPEQIAKVARGQVLDIPIEAPSLRIGRAPRFIKRKIANRIKVA